ncbi:hypothetical protein E4K67_24395 [Desulfosporosinus fructosivorans]|uniref:Uncharacterized protein n=1 Tax=Desulfosporosinus fructosivorans TaxID=2018669 RepID=A0A4Z0QZ23_9FIRM|nr:hypothetical protein E4K67_24395 [Desulfosporosinus fructosivorans]
MCKTLNCQSGEILEYVCKMKMTKISKAYYMSAVWIALRRSSLEPMSNELLIFIIYIVYRKIW